MWVWEVDDEVEPIALLLSNLWELLLCYAQVAMLCLQTWIGLSEFMKDARDYC